MTPTLSIPVNLLTEIDEDSSQSCLRRVMARILGHSGLALAEAHEIWVQAGYDSRLWRDYVPTINAMA